MTTHFCQPPITMSTAFLASTSTSTSSSCSVSPSIHHRSFFVAPRCPFPAPRWTSLHRQRCRAIVINSPWASPSLDSLKRFHPSPPPRFRFLAKAAYISAPASDPNSLYFLNEKNNASTRFLDAADLDGPKEVITMKLLANLLMEEKWRLLISTLALIGCSSCTLSMPLFSGQFFETVIGKSHQTLGKLVSKLAAVYFLEPVFTVTFVTNMTYIWEKVMANLRRRVFQRVLIQKVEFFDRHKVGELTGLLSTELGSVKDLVNENVSRDRGFRALSEVDTLILAGLQHSLMHYKHCHSIPIAYIWKGIT